MNKILIGTFAVINIFCFSAQAELESKDLVDLNNQHWAYNYVVKTVDNYKLISCFPDHTFRGEQVITRFELSKSILKLIKYIENNKKISLKNPSADLSGDKFSKFSDISKTDDNFSTVIELKDNYNIVLIPPYEKTFSGKSKVTRYETAYAVNQILSLYTNKSWQNNPYQFNREAISQETDKSTWFLASVKSVCDNQIMLNEKNDFKGNENVNRYQLANTLSKTVEYLIKLKY